MSFNPARMNGLSNGKARPQPNPHAGLKHSQIARSSGVQSVTVEDVRSRQDMAHGWKIPIFKGSAFEVEFQYMLSRNATGQMCHPTKDRCIRVLSGSLFVAVGDEPTMLRQHQSMTLTAGVKYMLATSGNIDAELLICQGTDYESDLQHLTPPEAQRVDHEVIDRMIQKVATPVAHERRADSMAHQQAEEMAAKRAARRTPMNKARAPLPGQTVEGVNPRPVGAGGYNEE